MHVTRMGEENAFNVFGEDRLGNLDGSYILKQICLSGMRGEVDWSGSEYGPADCSVP